MMSLRRSVYERLKRAILSGRHLPGERLIEADIASEFGVSRTPVREVLRMLELEGLVANRDRRGARVASVSPEQVRQLYEVRIGLESWSAGLAAERATPEQVAGIEESVRELLSRDAGDARGLVRVGGAFHDRVAVASGNQYLVGYLQQIRTQLSLFRMTALASPQRLDAVRKEYLEILEAIRAHDAQAAEALSRRHAAVAMEIAMANLEALFAPGRGGTAAG